MCMVYTAKRCQGKWQLAASSRALGPNSADDGLGWVPCISTTVLQGLQEYQLNDCFHPGRRSEKVLADRITSRCRVLAT